MKHFWYGLGILAVLLALALGVTAVTRAQLPPITEKLEQAAQEARDGRWDQAVDTARQARDNWDRVQKICNALSSHSQSEQMEQLFAQMEVFISMDDRISFAAACAQLAVLCEAMGESQALHWWCLL